MKIKNFLKELKILNKKKKNLKIKIHLLMKYIQKFKDIIEKILIDVNDKKFINYNLKKYKDNKIKIEK